MEPLPEDIRIRVSAEDKARFTAAAAELGLSLSAWARMQLALAIKRDGEKPGRGKKR